MEIKIEDYLSEYEMKKIAIEAFKEQIRGMFRKENTIANMVKLLSKKIIFEEIDKNLPNSETFIAKKVSETIHNYDYENGIFKLGNIKWTEDGLGMSIIREKLKESKEIINTKTLEAIESNDYSKIVNNILANQIEEFIEILNKIKP